MNKVVLLGRLTRDPEVRYPQNSDISICRFNLAVDRRYKKEGQQSADFPSCIAFGKTADGIGKWFHKGSMICISGRLQTGSYTNKDGQKVYTTDVVVEEWNFASSKNEADSEAPTAAQTDNSQAGGYGIGNNDLEEDLPFN